MAIVLHQRSTIIDTAISVHTSLNFHFSHASAIYIRCTRTAGHCTHAAHSSSIAPSPLSSIARLCTHGGGVCVCLCCYGLGGDPWYKDQRQACHQQEPAVALFLKHMTGKCEWYKGRRLGAKTMIWRMDLLSLRFRMLPAVERDAFRTQSAAALAQKKTERAAILHNLRSAPSESGKASANAYAAHLSDRVQACAWHKG